MARDTSLIASADELLHRNEYMYSFKLSSSGLALCQLEAAS